FDERTRIVFCNVGQGDAAYIRIKNKVDVLIDAGPDKKVLSCLGKYMPFWDRKIELIFISHNQKDHFGGLNYILDRYQIGTVFLVNDLNASLQSFKRLKEKIINKKVKIEEALAGKIIQAVQLRQPACRQAGCDEARFTMIWPIRNLNSSNDNDFSNVLLFEERGIARNALTFRVLFTGDASPFVLSRLSHGSLGKIDILKIPHHGSKNGLTKKFLDLADPMLAVISVGKNNSYGHPAKEILDMLKAKNVKIRRTDAEGDIIFKINTNIH
ncbi:MAG: hypothetical protein Q7U68_04705, partial [Candidatus Roizmanbacteria bacterium]|nr:hypothetical protein [Candidatus Roizmanbacteria bacterium]